MESAVRRPLCHVLGHNPGQRETVLGMDVRRCRRCGNANR